MHPVLNYKVVGVILEKKKPIFKMPKINLGMFQISPTLGGGRIFLDLDPTGLLGRFYNPEIYISLGVKIHYK